MIGMIDRRRAAQGGSPAPNYLITEESNKPVYDVCLAQGWCSSEGMTYEDAANVTDIGVVFRGNNNITHFEEFQYFGVTSITQYAFSGCYKLEEIKLPNSVTTIGNYAFYNSKNLKVISLPNSLGTLGNRVLASCGSLLYVDIPASVTSISEGTFTYQSSNNGSMQYIKVYPTTPPSIAAVQDDTILKGTNDCPVYVPDASVNAYKTAWSNVADRIRPLSAFSEQYMMTTATNAEVLSVCYANGWCESPDYMTYAEAKLVDNNMFGTVFKGNRDIKHFDEFEYFGVSSLSDAAFSACLSLVSISFPDTLNSIPSKALYFCSALTTVKFPDSLTTIRDSALEASHIVDINLPDIGDINYKALACSYAKTVTIGGQGATIKNYALNLPVLEWMKITTTNLSTLGTNNIINANAIIYVPDAQVNDYKAAANWSAYASQIKGLSEFVEPT